MDLVYLRVIRREFFKDFLEQILPELEIVVKEVGLAYQL